MMIKLIASVCIEAPAESVWARLAQLEEIPLVKRAANLWTVFPQGDKSLLTSEAELELKGGLIGRMLEPLVGPLMGRMAPNALAAFKYLVENRRPYQGKVSELPRVSAIC